MWNGLLRIYVRCSLYILHDWKYVQHTFRLWWTLTTRRWTLSWYNVWNGSRFQIHLRISHYGPNKNEEMTLTYNVQTRRSCDCGYRLRLCAPQCWTFLPQWSQNPFNKEFKWDTDISTYTVSFYEHFWQNNTPTYKSYGQKRKKTDIRLLPGRRTKRSW